MTKTLQPDPQTRALLDTLAAAGIPPMHTLPVAEARQAMLDGRVNDVEPPAIGSVEDRSISGPGGPIALRRYVPQARADGALPALLYFHGGGFVLGDLDTHDALCRQLCARSSALVVAVDYRLAPEHPYPAAVEDALASFDWLVREHASVGADPARLAVGGDSAGGTLAAVVAQHARDQGVALAAQLLLYPVVDLSRTYPSHAEHADRYPIPAPVLEWFWAQYFAAGDSPQTRAQVWASPTRVERFDGLAPAFVLTAGLDPLRDEGALYAERLTAAGVETVYQCVMGTVHGFLRLGGHLTSAGDAIASAAAFLARRT